MLSTLSFSVSLHLFTQTSPTNWINIQSPCLFTSPDLPVFCNPTPKVTRTYEQILFAVQSCHYESLWAYIHVHRCQDVWSMPLHTFLCVWASGYLSVNECVGVCKITQPHLGFCPGYQSHTTVLIPRHNSEASIIIYLFLKKNECRGKAWV